MKIYVNVNAMHDGDGTKENLFYRIQEAAKIARARDEVLVVPGVYRENVEINVRRECFMPSEISGPLLRNS